LSPEKAIGAHEIAGWKVTQIEPRRLVLASDYREVSFDLFGRMRGGRADDTPHDAPAILEALRNAGATEEMIAAANA
jgi:hypothetical protein